MTLRDRAYAWTSSAGFQRGVMALIVANAVLVGLESSDGLRARYGAGLLALDRLILALFSAELVLRLWAAPSRRSFFACGWNWFDLLIVAGGWVPGAGFVSAARLLRVLRLLRAVSVVPALQKLVSALLRSLPSLGHILMLLALLMYVYAVIGTFAFGEAAPESFGSLGRSTLTLFAVMTLEGWVDVMEAVRPAAPWAWAYFLSFILLGTFVSLNFFVGVIVNNMQSEHKEDDDRLDKLIEAVRRLEARLGPRPERVPRE